jgi:dCMP deaminase
MFDAFNRPDWDSYFIALCFQICQRSIDPSTQHGCVVVDNEHAILSTGYNSPPRGCNDEHIPLTRPEKYPFMEHAEANAIINAARNGISLKDSTFYITGQPCEHCFRKIRGVGAKKIILGGVGAKCINEETFKIISILNEKSPIEVIRYHDDGTVEKLLARTGNYYTTRGI